MKSRLNLLVTRIKSLIHTHCGGLIEHKVTQINLCAIKHYKTHHGDSAAGSMTLTTIIALVPACIIAFSIIANLPGVTNYQQTIVSTVLDQFVPENTETVKRYLTQFIEESQTLSYLQLLLLIVSTLLLIHSVNQSINQMFHTQHERHGLAVFGVYLAILVFGPMLLGFSLALSLYVSKLPYIASFANVIGEVAPISAWIPFWVAWLSLFALYYFVPSERIKPLLALVGSLVAAVLIEISKFAFGLYADNVQTYQVLYGTLAAIPLFLIWIYLTWTIILFGASLTWCMKENS